MKDWLDLNRRDFLAALGAAYGTAACVWAAPRSRFVDYAGENELSPRERFVNTLCPMCPGGCGLKMRIVHGCAVGVRGNDEHPISRGGLCSRASAILQDVYNPDRLLKPLRCVGPRGSGKWEAIEWNAAINLVGDRLGDMREAGNPQGLTVVLGRDRGLLRTSWQRMTRAYGTPNLIEAFPEDNLGVLPAVLATHGVRQRLGYDLAAAHFVLSFSSAWLDGHWSTEQSARAFAEFRRGRPGFRPRWIHVEPRLSLTAAKADEWIPIRPGVDGVLALGIAHVLIREGLYDRDFVERHGYGFDDWVDRDGISHLGFRRFVLTEYSPAKVQRSTGVPEGTVFRLARDFSANRPAVALGFDGGGSGRQSTYSRMAIHCLNALVGSIDVPGGITVFQEFSLLENGDAVDEIASRGLSRTTVDGSADKRRLSDSSVDLLVESLETQRPYATEALILADADPVFSLAEGARFGAALANVPLVVGFSGYHNDSNQHADLIFPTLHGLHRWNFDIGHTLKGHSVVTLSQPIMDLPPGMRDPYDVIRAIAHSVGGSTAKSLPWSDSQEAVNAVCRELFDRGKGAAFGPANEESWSQLLESRGWRAPFAKDFDEFRRALLEGGGWTDPIYFHREWDRVFHSPSGKFAFSSALLARSFEAMNGEGDSSQHDLQCLPDCRAEARKRDETYPLELYVYDLPNLVGVSSPNLPWLNDLAGAYMFQKWRTWAEIHPETAEYLGIEEDDHVEVRTPNGKLTLRVKLYTGLLLDVVAVPFGFGRREGGRWCKGIGENPAQLVNARLDPLTGSALWTATRASVRKV